MSDIEALITDVVRAARAVEAENRWGGDGEKTERWLSICSDALRREVARLTAERDGWYAKHNALMNTTIEDAKVIDGLTAENQALREAARWVKVGERYPNEIGYYDVYNETIRIQVRSYWGGARFNVPNVTHWHEIRPAPPEGEA